VTPGLVQQRVRAPRVRADEWVGGHRIGSIGPRVWWLNVSSDVGVRTNERRNERSSRNDASFNPFMMKEFWHFCTVFDGL
jgi:hypothetical protein